MKTIKDIMNTAIAIEKEGASFYRMTALQTKNALVAATFEYLAREEERHIKIFTDYAESNQLSDYSQYTTIDPLNIIKRLFTRKLKQGLTDAAKTGKQKPDVYEQALVLEKKSYDLYNSHLNLVEGEKEKKLLIFLSEQENEHARILQESQLYLNNPGDWFQKEERWMQT